jgi:hypothetical protein
MLSAGCGGGVVFGEGFFDCCLVQVAAGGGFEGDADAWVCACGGGGFDAHALLGRSACEGEGCAEASFGVRRGALEGGDEFVA